ncbi:MAG TPA: helix-turn-helix transcriptional regulator [Amycolatopsis sp.]|nr:helix-turn-helix transcriptional regulator [Amycolatopsis sp.]
MTTATSPPLQPIAAAARTEAAQVWRDLAPLLIAPGRIRAVKTASASGKYPHYPIPLTTKLPGQPTAALLFDHDQRAHWLGVDLDPQAGDTAATLAAAAAVADLMADAGGRPILDRSPRGGVHVWARLPHPEPVDVVAPLVAGLRNWVTARFAGVKVDTMPMANTRHGCLSLPGSPCRGGGYRQLITPLHAALAAARTKPADGVVYRLATLLGVTTGDLFAPTAPETIPDEEAAIPGGPQPLPDRALDYLRSGVLAEHPTRSEARWSALLMAAWRGWSLSDIREHLDAGQFEGLSNDIHRPHKTGHRFLNQEWKRVLTTVRHAQDTHSEMSSANLVRQSVHTHDLLHRGAQGHWTNRWLQAAEVWALEHYVGARLLTVLAVLSGTAWLALLQDNEDRLTFGRIGRYTPGAGVDSRVAELPVRSLHLVSGLIGIDTIADVLRDLNDTAGSPLLLVDSGAGTSRGSRYYLHQPASEPGCERHAGRANPLDPVWSELGLAAWWIYVLLRDQNNPHNAAQLARMSGLGRSAVYGALRTLREHELVTSAEPGRYRTSSTDPAEVGRRIGADKRYASALQRIRTERQAWKQILASWALAADQRASDAAPPDTAGPSETLDVNEAEVENIIGPAPWSVLLAKEPPFDLLELPTVEDRAIQLLEDLLGAQRLGP